MEEVSIRCVQLKGLPVSGTDTFTVTEYLDQTEFRGRYLHIAKHQERDDDIRWLVLFKCREDAEKCIRGGTWTFFIKSNEELTVYPDYCSECIVPTEWKEDGLGNDWVSIAADGADGDENSFSIIPESESIDSNDLFLSGEKLGLQREFLENSKEVSEERSEVPYTKIQRVSTEPAVKSELFDKSTDEMIHSLDMFGGGSLHSSWSVSVKSSDLFGSGRFEQSPEGEPTNLEQEPRTIDVQASSLSADAGNTEDTENCYENVQKKNIGDKTLPVISATAAMPTVASGQSAGMSGEQLHQVVSQSSQACGHISGQIGIESGQHSVQTGGQFCGWPEQIQGLGFQQFAGGMNNPAYDQVSYRQGPHVVYQQMMMMPHEFGGGMMLVNCTYNEKGQIISVLPASFQQSPTTPVPPSNLQETLPHVYDTVKPYSFTQNNTDGSGTEYTYMSRFPSQQDREAPSSESPYSRIDSTKIPIVYAPKLPPRDEIPSSSAEGGGIKQASEDTDELRKNIASNLKIIDESRNSLEAKPEIDDAEDEEQRKKREKEGCCKIKVSGLPRSLSKETVELFFESKKRSGGDEIVLTEMKTDKGEAIIEFEDPSVAQRVLEKHTESELVLQGTPLKVMLHDPTIDKNKVFVTGLAKETSQESLELFCEARCGHSPTAVVYGETPGTALLQFGSETDFKHLQKECSNKPLDGKYLVMYEVEVTSSIKVTGCGDRASEDALTFYFENKRRSQGGPVESVTHQERTGAYIVTFTNAADAEAVCKQRGHSLNLTEISVSLYYPCLDLDSSYEFSIPNAIELTDMNRYVKKSVYLPVNIEDPDETAPAGAVSSGSFTIYKLIVQPIHSTAVIAQRYTCTLCRFLLGNKKYSGLINVKVKECFGRVHWPKTTDEVIKISCTVEKNDMEGYSKVENWSERCMEKVQSVCDMLMVDDQFQIAEEAWSSFKEKLGEISISEPDKVAVFLNPQSHGMAVVGEKSVVLEICGQAKNLATELEQQLELQQQAITKKKRIKKYQVILLVAARFLDKVRKKSVHVEMSHENGEVTFKGPKKDVDDAIDQMVQTISSFAKKTIPGFGKPALDLLFTVETRQYIKTRLKSKKVTGVWDVTRNQTLELYSKNEADVEIAEKVLNSCIKQGSISLDSQMYAITQKEDWKRTIERLKIGKENLFKVEVKPNEVFIASVNYCHQEVVDEVKKVFDLHSKTSDFLEVDPGKFRFISMHKNMDLQAIERQFSKLDVQILKVDRSNGKGFKVTGNKDGCKLAMQQIKRVVDSVLHKDHVLTHPNISEYIHTSDGQQALADVEKNSSCKLEIATLDSMSNAPSKPQVKMKCHLGPNVIAVTEGDMTNMLVDAIVNPTDSRMNNQTGLSAAIIDKAGHEIQKKCDDCRRSSTILSAGDVHCTNSGRLPCQAILHVVMPEYQTGQKNEDKLKCAVRKCLEMADKRGYKKLMLPPLGFGKTKFPLRLALQWMFEELASQLRLAGKFETLSKIYICDIRSEVVDEVMSAMKVTLRKYAEVKEVKGEKNSPYSLRRSVDRARTFQESSAKQESSLEEQKEDIGAVGGAPPDTSTGTIKVSVVIGELVQQKVDVIVNSASPDLNLSHGNVSKAILRAGGSVIQDECRIQYPSGVRVGELAITSGGRMACKHIFHGVLVSWDPSNQDPESMMKQFVYKCLDEADNRRLTSIAFPALGTGILGYPVEVVAKVMFEALTFYQSRNPLTSLNEVLFVIWPGDINATQAFQKKEAEEKSKPKFEKISSPSERLADSFSRKKVRTNSKFIKSYGDLTVEIVQGDITQERSNVIVNSILRDLNLATGNVSRAILKAAGSGIQTECNTPANQSLMDKTGLVETSAGHMTFCQRIFHVESKTTESDWMKVVLTCLERADQNGFISMSFPALGTGGKGCSPESMTKAMIEAFKQYAKGVHYKHCLKQVRIVIFQPEMVSKFVEAAQDHPKSLKSLIPFWKKDTKEESITVYIYGDSRSHIDKAVNLLDSLYVCDKIHLSYRTGKKECEKIAAKQGVELRFDKSQNCFKLAGYNKAVQKVRNELSQYTTRSTQDDKEHNSLPEQHSRSRQSSVQDTPSRQSTDLYSATVNIVPLKSYEAEYYKVASRFLTETRSLYQIMQIDRIQNPYTYNQYIKKKQEMQTLSGKQVKEELLWFGCRSDKVSTVNTLGFTTTMMISSGYGTGLHFATSALQAVNSGIQPDAYGHRHIYLTSVLIGDFCLGKSGLRSPPMKPLGQLYDSTTDRLTLPQWFVIFDVSQTYPSFHVKFK